LESISTGSNGEHEALVEAGRAVFTLSWTGGFLLGVCLGRLLDFVLLDILDP
jgi:hypothetical protein